MCVVDPTGSTVLMLPVVTAGARYRDTPSTAATDTASTLMTTLNYLESAQRNWNGTVRI